MPHGMGFRGLDASVDPAHQFLHRGGDRIRRAVRAHKERRIVAKPTCRLEKRNVERSRLGIAQAAVAGVVHDADDAHAPLRCLRIRSVEVEITPEGVLLAKVVARQALTNDHHRRKLRAHARLRLRGWVLGLVFQSEVPPGQQLQTGSPGEIRAHRHAITFDIFVLTSHIPVRDQVIGPRTMAKVRDHGKTCSNGAGQALEFRQNAMVKTPPHCQLVIAWARSSEKSSTWSRSKPVSTLRSLSRVRMNSAAVVTISSASATCATIRLLSSRSPTLSATSIPLVAGFNTGSYPCASNAAPERRRTICP